MFFKRKATLYATLLCFGTIMAGCGEEEEAMLLDKAPAYALINDTPSMPSGGVITTDKSDALRGQDISKLVDGNADTKYVTESTAVSIVWNGNQSTIVTRYSLTSANDNETKDPESWTLYGSMDNAIWTTLDSRIDQRFGGRKEEKAYDISNQTAYKYYKLELRNNGGSNGMQVAEWTLQQGEATINMDDLIEQYAGGFTYDDTNPMGTQNRDKHVTTEADRKWLADPYYEADLLPASPSLTQFKYFPVTLYPYNNPLPADVNQHTVGDCWALAVFASFAYLCPDFIKSIITEHADGSFTVKMFDPQGQPIEVGISSTFLADSNGNIGAPQARTTYPHGVPYLKRP